VRILFTFIGGHGHFIPLISIARTAVAQGHTVAFGCGPSMVSTVRDAGFAVFPLGSGSTTPPQRLPLRPLDSEREDREFRDRFARRGAQQRVPFTLALCREWQPDLLICDETDFGSMVAAECLGLPYATVLVMAAGSFVRAAIVGEALAELRAAHDLPPDPGLEMLSRYLVLSPFPPGFRDPAYPLPPTAHSFRPGIPEPAGDAAPAGLPDLATPPAVYVTLGTVFNMESGDLFSRVLAGVRDLPLDVVVTIGPHLDPAGFGPQPANVTIKRYIPQDLLLPHCSLIVSHAGSGSVSGALRYGLPSVLIPMGADQPLNADRCRALGIARVLDPITATPGAVRTAVNAVLADPAHRRAAAQFRDEFAALPGPDYAIRLLERLAAAKAPLVT